MIAFVLTISHIVYLTASWQRQTREGTTDPVKAAIRYVGLVSVWSLAANLLGFASLLFVSAKPLRQFGMSGVGCDRGSPRHHLCVPDLPGVASSMRPANWSDGLHDWPEERADTASATQDCRS